MTPDEPSESDGSGTNGSGANGSGGNGSGADDDTTEGGLGGGDYLEASIMIVSALLLAGLLGYTASQAIVTPADAEPTATIDAIEPMSSERLDVERVRVTVGLENEGETGLSSVEVVVRCGSVERSLLFTHVPARGHRIGTVVCPRGSTPTANVAAWIEA